MKVADLVARFIAEQGIQHVFGVSGGASLHLIHGVHDHGKTKFIPTAHESGAAFAADAYARIRGLGCAMATSGPGATNLLTGVAASFLDSIPVLYITGNVTTPRFGAPLGVSRGYGFQELPIADIARGITKYAVTVTDASRVEHELEMAVAISKRGRPGPVLVDIPDDIQRAAVAEQHVSATASMVPAPVLVSSVARLLETARRPIFVWGAGMRAAAPAARALARRLGVPVACTWGAIDLLPADDPLMAGGFGTHGTRGANFAVQNADLVMAVGCRLDTKATGAPEHFARGAILVMVDIDEAEIRKFDKLGRRVDVGITADATDFIYAMHAVEPTQTWMGWRGLVQAWKTRYASRDDAGWRLTPPYAMVRELARYTTHEDIIVSDTGTALGYLMQAFPFKGERFIHAFNATPMGYGFPGAIGAALATGRRVVCVTGDGSALMSLAELATIARHSLPIKILLLNNQGHAMCRQTQRQWLGGRYPATSIEGGLGFPDFRQTARAFGILTTDTLRDMMETPGPTFHEAHVDPDAQLVPQARFGQPIEDADPQLPREEFNKNMIVEPLKGEHGKGSRAGATH